jgi:hypothetical protein
VKLYQFILTFHCYRAEGSKEKAHRYLYCQLRISAKHTNFTNLFGVGTTFTASVPNVLDQFGGCPHVLKENEETGVVNDSSKTCVKLTSFHC